MSGCYNISVIVLFATALILEKCCVQKILQLAKKHFSIWQCDDCTCRFTQNVPDADAIGAYYQSTAYVSHSDTKKGFINKLYHAVRNYTIQSKKDN